MFLTKKLLRGKRGRDWFRRRLKVATVAANPRSILLEDREIEKSQRRRRRETRGASVSQVSGNGMCFPSMGHPWRGAGVQNGERVFRVALIGLCFVGGAGGCPGSTSSAARVYYSNVEQISVVDMPAGLNIRSIPSPFSPLRIGASPETAPPLASFTRDARFLRASSTTFPFTLRQPALSLLSRARLQLAIMNFKSIGIEPDAAGPNFGQFRAELVAR